MRKNIDSPAGAASAGTGDSAARQQPTEHLLPFLLAELRSVEPVSLFVRAEAADELERLSKTVALLGPRATAHDDLLEALQGLLNALDDANQRWPAPGIKSFLVADFITSTSPDTAALCNAARVAIAKAMASVEATEEPVFSASSTKRSE